ncbi:tRNA uracil 4-sulfurtransferase ThiI [Agaribacterium haliotis]|uniref:tRNA uracil 4-sulfurtransferase ThiI n=1 Tax=Agaribacterium haliotis TaxID=2013869 RepID=UPI000BB56A5A|nr:tRNA uracil 4-sulfurtransferase ThiI [Agaribacterium haliotis]
MQYIVRLFPEIMIKSKPVRKRWCKKLTDNLRILARRIDEKASVVLDWDRIIVRSKGAGEHLDAQLSAMLACTPGIAHFTRVSAHKFASLDDIYQLTYDYWQDKLDGRTFCVRVKRSGQHDWKSIDIERYVGGGLNQHTTAAGVRLKDPDVTVALEIKDDELYIVEQRTEGLGGFPLGTQDEDVLSLVSGGFDSTVASYMLMRRGMKTHFCFFNLGGREHELAVKEVAFYLWNKFGSSHRVKFISVPFETVVAQILEHVGPANMGVVLKRMMYRAASQVAERAKVNAIVTGEAISQVSSQTLHNLAAIEKVTDKLILRPLICMDKPEIIDLSRKIGTEEFSAAIPEYCGVISVKPSSSVKMHKLLAEEAQLDFSVLESAIANSRAQSIDEVMNDISPESGELPLVGEGDEQDYIVLDIRHPDEVEQKPLAVKQLKLMPFYSLNSRIHELDKNQAYALYCDKGVMSQLHAAHLQEQGFAKLAVYKHDK